jgi:hypothetical protein
VGVASQQQPLSAERCRPTFIGVVEHQARLGPSRAVGVDAELEFDSLGVHNRECVLSYQPVRPISHDSAVIVLVASLAEAVRTTTVWLLHAFVNDG